MAVNFNIVDPNARASQIFIELQGVRRSISGGVLPPTGLIVGQYDQSLIAGITDYVPVQVTSADEAASLFGFGSEIHRQSLWIFGILGGFSDKVWVSPIPEIGGAVVATGTIIFATNTGSSGTYYFSIGGDLITVAVPNGATPTEVGDLLVTSSPDINSTTSELRFPGLANLEYYIDDVRFYNRPLNSIEINQNHDTTEH